MLILAHVLVALCSIVLSTLGAFKPSRRLLAVSYSLIALTLASGTYLVISLHTPMLRACATGLTYLAAALSGVVIAHYRLAASRSVD